MPVQNSTLVIDLSVLRLPLRALTYLPRDPQANQQESLISTLLEVLDSFDPCLYEALVFVSRAREVFESVLGGHNDFEEVAKSYR